MKPKIGDFVAGFSPLGDPVVGPVVTVDETRGLAIVGPWQQNSSAVTFASCEEMKQKPVAPAKAAVTDKK